MTPYFQPKHRLMDCHGISITTCRFVIIFSSTRICNTRTASASTPNAMPTIAPASGPFFPPTFPSGSHDPALSPTRLEGLWQCRCPLITFFPPTMQKQWLWAEYFGLSVNLTVAIRGAQSSHHSIWLNPCALGSKSRRSSRHYDI